LTEDYTNVLNQYASILDSWVTETGDKGQYLEDEENLKLMLGIWGKHAVNPEYNSLREKFPDLPGSLFYLKSEPAILIDSTYTKVPLVEI
jgi:N-sulfoglucosamine sulfohydrolase